MKMDKDDTILKYIQLSIIPGLGPVSQNRILRLCGSIDACYERTCEELLRGNFMADRDSKISEKRIHIFAENRTSPATEQLANRIKNECMKKQIQIITPDDDRYPARFHGIPDMPVVLYAAGNMKINEYAHSVGIVGARRCSAEGKAAAIKQAEKASADHFAVISGLAKGIDSYAHTAAVRNNGYTIAVSGSGPDICYPAEHRKLYAEIILHGCVLSEYPPGTTPRSYMFPERNRLIAALSDELLVIDAGSRSGTNTTVNYCRKYGRKVTVYR